jgi:hypothetical protein
MARTCGQYRGHTHAFIQFARSGCQVTAEMLKDASGNGHGDILHYILTKHNWTNSDLSAALWETCNSGDISTYTRLVKAGAMATIDCLQRAALHGCDDMVQDMLTKHEWTNSDLSAALCGVCKGGDISTYTLLVKAGAKFTVDCLKGVAWSGKDDMLQEVLTKHKWTNSDLLAALCGSCEGGEISTCRLLVNAGATFTVDCLKEAAQKGHDDMVQHLLTKHKWTNSALAAALYEAREGGISYTLLVKAGAEVNLSPSPPLKKPRLDIRDW